MNDHHRHESTANYCADFLPKYCAATGCLYCQFNKVRSGVNTCTIGTPREWRKKTMMNSFSGVGQIVTQPQYNRTTLDHEYCKFIVSIPAGKSQDGKEKSDRINCTAYGKAAEIAKYIETGDIIGITGPLKTTNYKKEDGTWVNSWNIQVYNLDIIKKNTGATGATFAPAQQTAPAQVQQTQTTPQAAPLPPAPPELLPFEMPYSF